jgi:SAM-dependent methyltransferase
VITATSFSAEMKAARLSEFSIFVERFDLLGKRAIEVGCGKGGMVDVMVDAGLNAVGMENGVLSVEEAQLAGRNVVQGYLDIFDVNEEEKFDVFVSFNYIEHQPDTQNFVRGLHRISKPGAVGYVTAPNASYLLKTHTLYEFVADHLIYFTEETMRLAFELNGFDVVNSAIINGENDIALTVRKREQVPIQGRGSVELLVKELSHFVSQHTVRGKKVAVWGAGHRTLALLSMAKLNGITFIVDSADFKQGKYSPVMHTPIVSPSTLEYSDIDVVIVMVPGIYPDEVINTIRSFSRTFEIYKLLDNRLVLEKP